MKALILKFQRSQFSQIQALFPGLQQEPRLTRSAALGTFTPYPNQNNNAINASNNLAIHDLNIKEFNVILIT